MDWFRWYHGACQHPKLHKASRIAKVSRGLVIAAWAAVLEQASQADERGSVAAITADDLAYLIDVKPATAGRILDAMRSVGLIEDDRAHGWDERQRHSDDSAARKRAERERKNAECVHGSSQNGLDKPFHVRGLDGNVLKNNETQSECHATVPPRTEQNRADIYPPPVSPPLPADASPSAPPADEREEVDRERDTDRGGCRGGVRQSTGTPGRAAAARQDDVGARGCRIPWQCPADIPRECQDYARERGLDPVEVGEGFIDYWRSRAGAGGRKADWPATWRGWCRRDAEQRGRAPARRRTAMLDAYEDAIAADAREADQAPRGTRHAHQDPRREPGGEAVPARHLPREASGVRWGGGGNRSSELAERPRLVAYLG